MTKREAIIGIDLGTTNSVCAVMENGSPVVIANAEGKRTTPSVVGFTKTGETLVGDAARRQAVTNPLNTIYSAKRFIGSRFSERKEEAGKVPFKAKEVSSGAVGFDINGEMYSPEQISAFVLQKLKKAAEDYLGQTVTKAVITVPAYFNDSQRQSTKDAARIAGLEVLRLVNEPTAASLAYGLEKKKSGKVFVTDIGGGTTDFSCLEIDNEVIEVLSTSGDAHLAGDNLDEVLVDYLLKTFKDNEGIDISKDPMAMQRLKEAAEKAKIELSSSVQTDINLPFLTANDTGPKHLTMTLTRAKFEQLISPLIEKMFKPCHQALADAKLSPQDIDEVLLVGGSTRVPLIQQKVREIFGKEPSKGVNPDEVVALGAAVQGAILSGEVKDVLLLDVTPLSLGIETLGGVMTKLLERNSTIPTRKTQVFSTAADNQPGVDISVLQGEREMAKDNRQLARFSLTDIPPAPRGVPQIEVTFDIDANGILSVSAKDLGTSKEQKVTISSSTKLSEEEIQQAIKDAEANKEADAKKKQLATARNELDTMCFQAEKMLKDNEDKITTKTEFEEALKAAREKLTSEDVEVLTSAKSELEAVVHKVAEEMYKATQAPAEQQSEMPKASGEPA